MVEILKDDVFTFDAGIVINDNIYFSSNKINALYKKNLKNHECLYLGSFLEEDVFARNLHKKCIRWMNKLIFMSNYSNYIGIYGLEENEFEYIKIPKYRPHEASGIVYGDCVVLKDTLWLFPFSADAQLLKINLNDYSIIEMSDFTSWCETNLIKNGFIAARVALLDDSMIFGHYLGNEIVRYNPEFDSLDFFNTDVKDLMACFVAQNSLWINSERNNVILNYNLSGKLLNCYECKTTEITNKRCVTNILEYKDKILALAAYEKKIYIKNEENNSFDACVIDDSQIVFYDNGSTLMLNYADFEDDVIIFPRTANGVLKINPDFKISMFCDNDFSPKQYESQFPSHFNLLARNSVFNNMIIENSEINLKDLVKFI